MRKRIVGLHRQEGVEREENDFYATHPAAIPPLLNLLGWQSKKVIRENSCGQGHLSQALEIYGHTVVSTDLCDRGYGLVGVDFLTHHWTDDLFYDAVIMNPPYKFAREFVEKSLTLAPVVCAFLKIQFLESEGRKEWLEASGLKTVAVFSWRVRSSKNALFAKDESSTQCYCWFVWERGFTGKPEIVWL